MGYILTLLLLPIGLLYSVKRPWFGLMMYYLFTILQPKYIWYWVFPQDLAITKYFVLAIFAGLLYNVAASGYKLSFFSARRNIAVFILFCLVYLSHFFSPYPPTPFAQLVLKTFNTIVAVYFMGQMCKPSLNDLKYMAFILAGIVLYYSYWSNMQYISGQMYLYSTNGRLRGPYGSTYFDENKFSIVFIICLPSLAFLFFLLKRLWQKLFIIGSILSVMHSLVLVGSRGGLLAFCSMGLYSLLFLIKTKKGKTPYFLIVVSVASFLVFYSTQGGSLKDRTSATISESKEGGDEPLDPRVLAWSVGKDMIFDYPILGVGVERFLQAARAEYGARTVNVAHNTFIQITACSGILAGLTWLYLVFNGMYCGRQIWKKYPMPGTIENYLNNAFTTGILGFFVASIFLDLLIAEQFYFLLLMQLLLKRLVLTDEATEKEQNQIIEK